MNRVTVSGKVMLSGEYAVLHGGTAVLLPVPRYITVSELPAPPETPYFPMVSEARAYPIPELAPHELRHGVPHLIIDSNQFFATDRAGRRVKLGLGLSAAEAVGVVALRYQCAGFDWKERRNEVTRHALDIHLHVQKGIGSGADVAACAFGQPIKFRTEESGYTVEPITVDPHRTFPMTLVWTGMPADTRVLVQRFERWVHTGSTEALKIIRRLVQTSHELADSWFDASHERLFKLIDTVSDMLDQCSDAASLAYMLPFHRRIAQLARELGTRAKPTGAGGGDMLLYLGDLTGRPIGRLMIPLRVPYLA